jgi:hypothetical protein
MKKRSYKITFGLKEGYAPKARVHTLQSAGRIIRRWMSGRLSTKQPLVSGLLQAGLLFFPAISAAQVPNSVTVSPSAIFSGELSSVEDLKRKNKEVMQTLESLASALRKGLKQESVFIIYRDENWCIQQ